MARFALKRLLLALPLVFIVSMMVFALQFVIPGDAASALLGEDATAEQLAAVRAELGLDRPPHERYLDWVGGVLHWDFGTSLRNGEGIGSMLVERLPVTLSLVLGSLVISAVGGIAAGVFVARRPDSRISRAVSVLVAGSLATPNFFFGLVLVLVCALWLNVLPATGYVPLSQDPIGWFTHMLLPWVVLATGGAGEVARQTMASMSHVLSLDYVRTARAKGLANFSILYKHALKTAMLPIITGVGLLVGRLFSQSVVVEGLFVLPGIGKLMIGAVLGQDMPLIQGILFFVSLVVIMTNILVDLSYAYFDPRLRDDAAA